MLEAMLTIFCFVALGWVVCTFIAAVSYARDVSYQPPADLKWGINPRVMRWLIPIIVVGIVAYGYYLKYLGLV